MQFHEKKTQGWKNVCIVWYEFLCGKYQRHQPRLLCLKNVLSHPEMYVQVSTVNFRLRSKLLSFAKTAEISEGLRI